MWNKTVFKIQQVPLDVFRVENKSSNTSHWQYWIIHILIYVYIPRFRNQMQNYRTGELWISGSLGWQKAEYKSMASKTCQNCNFDLKRINKTTLSILKQQIFPSSQLYSVIIGYSIMNIKYKSQRKAIILNMYMRILTFV